MSARMAPLEHASATLDVVIVVSAPGFDTQRRKINIAAGVLSREHVALAPAAAADGAGEPTNALSASERTVQAPPLVRNDEAMGVPAAGRSPPDGEGGAEPVYKRWWFWTAIGAVAAAGIVSAVLIGRRGDDCQAAMGGACPKW